MAITSRLTVATLELEKAGFAQRVNFGRLSDGS